MKRAIKYAKILRAIPITSVGATASIGSRKSNLAFNFNALGLGGFPEFLLIRALQRRSRARETLRGLWNRVLESRTRGSDRAVVGIKAINSITRITKLPSQSQLIRPGNGRRLLLVRLAASQVVRHLNWCERRGTFGS
jgi:hypothetical protein